MKIAKRHFFNTFFTNCVFCGGDGEKHEMYIGAYNGAPYSWCRTIMSWLVTLTILRWEQVLAVAELASFVRASFFVKFCLALDVKLLENER